eukprot:1152156-Rhodomonas_salina.1
MRVTTDGLPIKGSPFVVDIYPDVISPPDCSVVGSGLTVGTAGVLSTFLVQLRDRFSNLRRYNELAAAGIFTAEVDGPLSLSAEIVDLLDSSYQVRLDLTVSGTYKISVRMTTEAADRLAESPYTLVLKPGPVTAALTSVSGEGTTTFQAGSDAFVRMEFKDEWTNPAVPDVAKIFITSANNSLVNTTFAQVSTAIVDARYTITRSDEYQINVQYYRTVNGSIVFEHMGASPFAVTVTPGPPHPPNTMIYTDGTIWRVDVPKIIRIVTADKSGNNCTVSGAILSASISGGSVIRATTEDLLQGSYLSTFVDLELGDFTLEVKLNGQVAGMGPLAVQVVPGYAAPSNSFARSLLSLESIAGDGLSQVTLQLRDRLHNPTSDVDAAIEILTAPVTGLVTVEPVGTQVTVSFNATRAGSYQLTVRIGQTHFVGSPFTA